MLKKKVRQKIAEFRGVFDAGAYADREGRPDESRAWFSVAPGVMYPVTIAWIATALVDTAGAPAELVDPRSTVPNGVAAALLAEAREIGASALTLALYPKDSVNPAQHADRARALDLARRWYTQALAVQVGGPLGLHITNDPAYRM